MPAAPEEARVARGRDQAAAEVAGVRLTSPGRVLYPGSGATKRDVAAYYEAVGEELLRRAARRPLSVVRCPDGVGGDCFYQKHPSGAFEPGLPQVRIQEKDEVDDYHYLTSVADLVSLVQYGALELHVWGSTVDRLEQPDRLVFDLDPSPGVPFEVTKRTARRLRELLASLGLPPYLRATGGKGLHVVVPLVPAAGWDEAKAFAHAVARALEAADPENLTTALPKAQRAGQVFVDYLRNGRGATAVADYSVRARPGASVAVPLRWDELAALDSSAAYDMRRVRRRLAALAEDPWAGFEASAVPLSRELQAAAAAMVAGEGA